MVWHSKQTTEILSVYIKRRHSVTHGFTIEELRPTKKSSENRPSLAEEEIEIYRELWDDSAKIAHKVKQKWDTCLFIKEEGPNILYN